MSIKGEVQTSLNITRGFELYQKMLGLVVKMLMFSLWTSWKVRFLYMVEGLMVIVVGLGFVLG
jgi:hypothetical protein